MASKRVGRTAEEQALFDYLDAGKDFVNKGASEYEAGDPLAFDELGELDRLGPSAYEDITSDPRYKDNEMEALRQLEDQSKNGYSDRDKADLARIEQNASRANRGRQGAIRQEMENRGLGGSGLDFALRQQAAQDSAEQEAISGLEKNAQVQDRKQSAAASLGSLSSQLQSRDHAQASQKAAAADEIARFNTQNSNQRQSYNNQNQNSANTQNWNRTNQVADQNTDAQADYRRDKLNVEQGGATKQYDYATEMYNRDQAKKAAKAKKKAGVGSAIGGVVGGVAGAYFGGPAGAAAGASVGSSVGGSFAHGGTVPGKAKHQGDHPENDTVLALLSPEEVVLPRTVAKDPMKAAAFVAEENQDSDDVVGLLLTALSQMNKGKK